jgi:Mg2+ and Co2+ transporter CorA
MLTICQDRYACQIHKVDVLKDGIFDRPNEKDRTRQITADPAVVQAFWDEIRKPLDPGFRVRALFIENITLSVLQTLGARYNIEPFFFASSANWIPSRYQEDPQDKERDHITVVLPFIRTVNNEAERNSPMPSNETRYPPEKGPAPLTDKKQTIDTQAPLVLSENTVLLQDLLAIHMVRSREENIIISYHHHSKLQKTTAKRLQSLVQRTGDSVYWQKIYEKSKDATFVFLAILWYALYAWDEALEVLYAHLSERLESADATTHISHTRELHKLQAHLLYYQQLLRDFEKSVEFVRDTPNPAMDHDLISEDERKRSKQLLNQEACTLLSEIQRLEKQRLIQSDRLKNAMQLAFSTVNIEDSRSMQDLTKATMRDSAAMKQISYLTMIFLPASYLSSVFGMNVAEINPGTLETLSAYVVSTIILTAITAWVIVALQEHSHFHPGGRYIVKRALWPVFFVYSLMVMMVTAVQNRVRRARQ